MGIGLASGGRYFVYCGAFLAWASAQDCDETLGRLSTYIDNKKPAVFAAGFY